MAHEDMVKHFLEISQLSKQEAWRLINRAMFFKTQSMDVSYPYISLANLFYENSTRTRVSFELAAKRLQMQVINLDLQRSSECKGETLKDTISTLGAMGVSLMVIRHSQDGLPQKLAAHADAGVHIVNAGDGRHAHPSQALLDFMTIIENKPDLSTLKIAIVGDIVHSRVANSLQCLSALLGVGQLMLVAPPIWQPVNPQYGIVTDSLEEGLSDADVVICLRIQKERMDAIESLDFKRYREAFALTKTTLAHAKLDAMLMHPGPINRGVEIDSDVADGSQSYILHQVQNGVFMRMAILEALVHQ